MHTQTQDTYTHTNRHMMLVFRYLQRISAAELNNGAFYNTEGIFYPVKINATCYTPAHGAYKCFQLKVWDDFGSLDLFRAF